MTHADADPLGSDAQPSTLDALIRQRIEEQGPISFAEFSALALYHPTHGYYSTLRGFGAEGDFVTSPEVHPVFGALLARQAVDVWQALGEPRPFRVLEIGAGGGALAYGLLRALQADTPAAFEAMHYAVEETSPSLRRVQEQRLADFAVQWGTVEAPHLVLANEVLDAYPAHFAIWRDGAARALLVGVDDDHYTWVEDDDPPDEVQRYLRDLVDVTFAEGQRIEINLGPRVWAERLGGLLRRGLAVVLDYGYTAADLHSRPQGTLLTYYRHTLGSDPLIRVGRQDISTHVNLTLLRAAAEEARLTFLGQVSQATLLTNLGLSQYRPSASQEDRRAFSQLLDPQGLGRIQAVFLGKDLPNGYRPAGVTGGTFRSPSWLPSLPPEAPPEDFLRIWREAFSGDDDDEPDDTPA